MEENQGIMSGPMGIGAYARSGAGTAVGYARRNNSAIDLARSQTNTANEALWCQRPSMSATEGADAWGESQSIVD
jgi:hypothetical protein